MKKGRIRTNTSGATQSFRESPDDFYGAELSAIKVKELPDFIAAKFWPELVEISADPADDSITPHQLVSGVSGWLTSDPPGHAFKYNNAGFTAAEKVVARISDFAGDEIAPTVKAKEFWARHSSAMASARRCW